METKANNLVVGVFVLMALAIGILFTVWLSRAGNSGPKKEFFVIFNGSVQGLTHGSYVLFSGLRVGEVTELGINPGNTSEIRAKISVDKLTPVKRNSVARLTYTGLTGVASIEVSGGQGEDLQSGFDGTPATMYAERSFVQNLLEGGQDTLARINNVVAKIDKLVAENAGEVDQTLKNIRSFSDHLAKNGAILDDTRAMMEDLRLAAKNISKLTEDVEKQKLVEDIKATSSSIREAAALLQKRLDIISQDIARFTGKGLKDLEGLVADGRKTLNSLDGLSRSLERDPQQVIFGKPAVPEYRGR